MRRIPAISLVLVLGVAPAGAHTTGIHDNCTKLNQKWPHGVGRRGATDKGGDVTNFYRNTDAYNRAVAHNGTLDRDNDKIACEKAYPQRQGCLPRLHRFPALDPRRPLTPPPGCSGSGTTVRLAERVRSWFSEASQLRGGLPKSPPRPTKW